MTFEMIDDKFEPGSPTAPIAPEILAVIVAAATGVLGRHLHITSIELQHEHTDSASRWTRQGRSSIQASHNLRTNRQSRGRAGQ
jgi:hypothetical protein